MKKIVRGILFVLIFTCIVSYSFAFEWGGSLNTNLNVSDVELFPSENASVSFEEKAILWGKLKINDVISLQMEGNYEFKTGSDSTLQNLNLDLLKLKMDFYPSPVAQVSADFGRVYISDSYGFIFNNYVDGGTLKINLPVANFSLFAGYTGLLNGKKIQISNSTFEVNQESIYSFAPGYIAAGFGIKSKNTFGNHFIGVEFSSFIPVEKKETRPTSFYGQITANGPIVESIYYDASAAFGLYSESQLKAGVMASGVISYYPDAIKSIFSANALFATDTFYSFVDPAVVIGELNSINGVLKTGVTASIRPLDALLVGLASDFVMDLQGSSFLVNCFQWTTSATWQVLSDFKLSLNLGQKVALNEDSLDTFFGSMSFVLNY